MMLALSFSPSQPMATGCRFFPKKRNVVQYVIGNVLVSTQMTQHELAAGLYAPLRIVLYENRLGTATFEYDRPSTLFGQYGNERVTAVARELDQKIYDALINAAT